MEYHIQIYFMLFIIYSFLGWVMECTLGVIQKHKFVNRGFLIGPYCPIYGIGVVGVSLLLTNFSNNLILLFILATILCGTLEYFTSYIMEKIFNARWWDYSCKKFNLNGRICLETLIPFGIISVLVIRFGNPWITDKLNLISNNILNIIIAVMSVIYIIDISISFNVILKFKNLNRQAKDNTEEISKKVRETAGAAIEKLKIVKEEFIKESKLNKRLISAFPNVMQKDYTRKKKKE